jgi:hypothetical protein
MKKKTLHLVSSLCIKGTLKMGLCKLEQKPEIAYLPIDLSFGYIPKDFSDKELCFALASHGHMEVFDQLKKFVTTDYSQYEKVIVWHGLSASELLLLYLMSVLVEGELYHVDIRDYKGKDPSRLYSDMGYVCPGDISDMISLAKQLNFNAKEYCREQWYKWASSTTPYRFSNIHTGVIEEYPEDFMDDSIKEYVQKKSSFIRVVGKIMMKYHDLFIPDSIIVRRLYQLRDDGEIELYCRERKNIQ